MIRRRFLALALAAVATPAWAQFDTLTQKPIVAAVRAGDEEKVRQALLKGGALPDATDRDGYSSLIRAAEHGDVDIVDTLLKRNARPDLQSRQGQTALMVAARLGHAEIVKLLLAKKADPNKPDFTGRTALTYARQTGKGTVENMLRSAGGRE